MAKVAQTLYHDDEQLMPKVDADGRKIVKVVADNADGFRYMHEDQMDEDDELLEKPAGWGVPVELTDEDKAALLATATKPVKAS